MAAFDPLRTEAPATDPSPRPFLPLPAPPGSRIARMLARMRDDLQLTIISLFGALTMLAITPFVVYRTLAGQTTIAVINALIVLSISSVVIYAWRRQDTARSGLVLALVTTAGCIAVSLLYARHGLLWSYVAFTTNFLLAQWRWALLFNTVLMIAIALHPGMFGQAIELAVFMVTAVLVSTCAFLFAFHTANQRRQLVALALHDALTGARNRRALEGDLQLAVETHRRSAAPCGLAMLDLDHFKRVNDRFGHEVGDRVLTQFAAVARAACRKRDRIYRFGGEEFVMLLPNTDADGLRVALEKLRTAVAEQLRDPEGSPVTVSAGAALLHGESDWTEWMARADAALYRAKGAGRNCVQIDGDPAPFVDDQHGERRRR